MKEFADLDGPRSEIKYSYETVRYWEKENKNLRAQRSALEVFVNTHNQLLNKHNYLEVEAGLKELTFLCNTVNEIARENNIPPKQAVTKFLSDVERQYGPENYVVICNGNEKSKNVVTKVAEEKKSKGHSNKLITHV